MTNKKISEDPKFIESQINLANARISQVEKADYLSEEAKEKQIKKLEDQLFEHSKKLEIVNTVV